MLIKQIPEDFIVNEVSKVELIKEQSNYIIYKLNKKNWDSFKIIESIAKALNCKSKLIGYAGNKDKQAVTTQYISFFKIPKSRIDSVKINDVKLEFQGYSKDRINLGDLKGNEFIINVRKLSKVSEVPKIQLENYFDDQRFGNKQNTHLVGKAILKKDFKLACELLNLQVLNKDYIGALRTHQRRLLRFYLSSYQSFLFNKILSTYLEKFPHYQFDHAIGKLNFSDSKLKNFKIPLIGFDVKFNKEIKDIAEIILKEEGITINDFIIKALPELVTESDYRPSLIEVKNIITEFSDDELNQGFKKAKISFFLTKSSYATLVIKKLEKYLA